MIVNLHVWNRCCILTSVAPTSGRCSGCFSFRLPLKFIHGDTALVWYHTGADAFGQFVCLFIHYFGWGRNVFTGVCIVASIFLHTIFIFFWVPDESYYRLLLKGQRSEKISQTSPKSHIFIRRHLILIYHIHVECQGLVPSHVWEVKGQGHGRPYCCCDSVAVLELCVLWVSASLCVCHYSGTNSAFA